MGRTEAAEERHVSTEKVIDRLRSKLADFPGATFYMQPFQDIRIGGRVGNSQYQFTLQASNIQELNEWAPKLLAKAKDYSVTLDVNSDQQYERPDVGADNRPHNGVASWCKPPSA